VPSDVAVVGFDDLPIAAYAYPPLTTIRSHARKQGEQAALAAIELLEGRPVGVRKYNLPLDLIIRHSCGAKLEDASIKPSPRRRV
jgi:DNA-binding LacI/PurR family transcriptional regulator